MESTESNVLFVGNLPQDVSGEKLEQVFGEFGPLKRCYIVKQKGDQSSSRGFGFVTFSLLEDAKNALSSKVTIDERSLRISFAERRDRRGKRASLDDEVKKNGKSAQTECKKMKKRHPEGGDDCRKRTICITGLGANTSEDMVQTLCKPYGSIEEIKLTTSHNDFQTGYVCYRNYKQAVRAFQKIHGMEFQGKCICAHLLSQETKKLTKKSLVKSQVIVRNLDFQCTKEEILNEFSRIGPIHDVRMPTREDDGSPVNAGFCFITFKSKPVAMEAIKIMNGKAIHGRSVIVDGAVTQEVYKQQKLEIMGCSQESEQIDNELEESLNTSSENEKRASLSNKSRRQHSAHKMDEEKKLDEICSIEPCNTDSALELDRKDEDLGGEISSEDELHDGLDHWKLTKKNCQTSENQYLEDAKEGKTVFVRNIPFECQNEELQELFEQFGEVANCNIVMNIETGHSRGSGFVKFCTIAEAESCLELIQKRTAGHAPLSLHGRELIVTKALLREDVQKIQTDKTKEKVKTDTRNLYLAAEGILIKDVNEKESLSAKDKQKREKAWMEKKSKLKDLNTFVSKTRLCVRNLPVVTDAKKLKETIWTFCRIPSKKIKQCKIMRSKERIQADGSYRSLGYAFLEFFEHKDALEMLRKLNNSSEAFGPKRKPIIDFAVENKGILKMRKEKQQRARHELSSKKTSIERKGKEKKEGTHNAHLHDERVDSLHQPHWKEYAVKKNTEANKCEFKKEFDRHSLENDSGDVRERSLSKGNRVHKTNLLPINSKQRKRQSKDY